MGPLADGLEFPQCDSTHAQKSSRLIGNAPNRSQVQDVLA
jgi:hypothetical protein